MGMICEFYRLSEDDVEKLKRPSFDYSNYLEENYASVYGEKHFQNDTVFSLTKTWDVIKFLLKKSDTSNREFLENLYGRPLSINKYDGYNFLLGKDVKILNAILDQIKLEDLEKNFGIEEKNTQDVYRFDGFTWDYIEKEIEILRLASELLI